MLEPATGISAVSEQDRLALRVVALGGGHGLAANLSALRHVVDDVTAVVTVADNGGSSGRLRRDFDCLPPGDLRQALAALCSDDDWGRTWADVLQHRFEGSGELGGHAVGNLLILALWELLEDPVAGLALVGRLLGAQGRVLPMSTQPLGITASVLGLDEDDPTARTIVHGQAEIATTPGEVVSVRLDPRHPPACPDAVAAVTAADWVVLGPGSWFTSVLPNLLVPGLRAALESARPRTIVTLNLVPQEGETSGFLPESYLAVLTSHAPALRIDVVVADQASVLDVEPLQKAVEDLGATLVLAEVASQGHRGQHDPVKLAQVYREIMNTFSNS